MSLKSNWILIFLFISGASTAFFAPTKKKFTLMLDPAGDATHTGRSIDGTFERGITLQCAEHLKKMLELNNAQVRVIVTRTPGETIEPLQSAQFANRLDADLYLHLCCFHEVDPLPSIALYSFMWHPITDLWQQTTSPLSFVPYQFAHRHSIKKRESILSLLSKPLTDLAANFSFTFKGTYGFPFKPLIGVQIPAFGIELGLRSQHEWKSFLEPLSLTINNIIASLTHE